MKCPACNSKSLTEIKTASVYTCDDCGAIFGQVYLGDSYGYVKPMMTGEDVPADKTRYFDFTCIGSNGVTRRHGWYDPSTKKIVQVG